MTTSETIQPSFVLDGVSEQSQQLLCYSPCSEYFFFSTSDDQLDILDIRSKSIVKNLDLNTSFRAVAISSDGCMLAVNADCSFIDLSNTIPAQLRIFHLAKDSVPPSFYIKPDFAKCYLSNLQFFPDGSKIVATHTNAHRGAWGKIFTFPNGEKDESTDQSACENITSDRNNKTLVCEEIDVFKQGFPIADDREDRIANAATDEEYFELYNQMYYASNIDGGFFCLSISPDTTRLLAGDNDGEVYIIESNSQKVLQCVRAYDYYKTVSGCHYSPVFSHEFVSCDESGLLDIWHVEELDDGTEEATSIRRLKFEAGTSCCTYSPDGKLVAVTSAAVFKTYIICSYSGDTLFNLVYKEELINMTYFCNTTSLFFGHLCQVATTHFDNSLCFWQLPLVYSLKTLCLLHIRAVVNYNNINNLPLSVPMKLQLKYLYV